MSDHIPDPTKMISDTPRMDEQINGKPCTRFEILAGDSLRNAAVPSEFARTIERELNAANDRIKRLEEDLMDAKNQYAVLVADVALYEDRGERIKRLEEAGDEMEKYCRDYYSSNRWNKAKEAKL
jgi:hypothetical protein